MTNLASTRYTPSDCEREPIHIPGAVQPHGVLLVFEEPSARLIQFSKNAPAELGLQGESLAGAPFSDLFEEPGAAAFERVIAKSQLEAPNHVFMLLSLKNGGGKWNAGVHRWDGVLIVELHRAVQEAQSAASLQMAVRKTISDLDACHTLAEFCQSAAEHFRDVTCFERVMIYRFLEDLSGVVIAESRAEGVDSFLGLRYPASDIPAQARALYLLSPYRLTADVNAQNVGLQPAFNPKTGKALDMSYCSLRATSPFHLEYLKNMGVTASLSFSIVWEEKLWGLVACHDRRPRFLTEEARGAGEILARLLGLQVGIKEEAERKTYVARLQSTFSQLAERLRDTGNFTLALTSGNPNLLTGMDACGAALCTGSEIVSLGVTPSTANIDRLRGWLQKQPWQPVWSTDQLWHEFTGEQELSSVASGVLALQLTQDSPEAVFWFRPELVEVVHWAGNPNEAASGGASAAGPLGPKRSFELWQEQVRGRSTPWRHAEQEHAQHIRDEMLQALLRHRALEIGRLNGELIRTNQELETFSAIASHDLQEPLRTITLHTELLFRKAHLESVPNAQQYVGFIRSATERMSKLVSSLLEYAQTGVRSGGRQAFPAQDALNVAMANLESQIAESGGAVEVGELPHVLAEKDLIIQLLQNLLSNALKYRRPETAPRIRISVEESGSLWLFSIQDNGIGFDPAFAENIFQPFKRLHGREVSGSGLGLAICRRIVESSGGRIWAEGAPGEGSTFRFTLQPGNGAMSAFRSSRKEATA